MDKRTQLAAVAITLLAACGAFGASSDEDTPNTPPNGSSTTSSGSTSGNASDASSGGEVTSSSGTTSSSSTSSTGGYLPDGGACPVCTDGVICDNFNRPEPPDSAPWAYVGKDPKGIFFQFRSTKPTDKCAFELFAFHANPNVGGMGSRLMARQFSAPNGQVNVDVDFRYDADRAGFADKARVAFLVVTNQTDYSLDKPYLAVVLKKDGLTVAGRGATDLAASDATDAPLTVPTKTAVHLQWSVGTNGGASTLTSSGASTGGSWNSFNAANGTLSIILGVALGDDTGGDVTAWFDNLVVATP